MSHEIRRWAVKKICFIGSWRFRLNQDMLLVLSLSRTLISALWECSSTLIPFVHIIAAHYKCVCMYSFMWLWHKKKQIKTGPQFSKLALWLFFFNKRLNIVFNHRNQIPRKLSSYSCKIKMELLSHSAAWEQVPFMLAGGSYFIMWISLVFLLPRCLDLHN